MDVSSIVDEYDCPVNSVHVNSDSVMSYCVVIVCTLKLTIKSHSALITYFVCLIAFYRFRRNELYDTYVTNIYAVCGINDYCVLYSTAGKNTQLPIEKSENKIPLNAESECVVNYVEIIHDCIPRHVDVNFSFISHGHDRLYLRVRNIITHKEVK